MGSKCDLEQDREVTKDEGKALADKFGCPFFETSAKTRVNVDEVRCCATLAIDSYAFLFLIA